MRLLKRMFRSELCFRSPCEGPTSRRVEGVVEATFHSRAFECYYDLVGRVPSYKLELFMDILTLAPSGFVLRGYGLL